jgi:hypothetical protein
MRARASGGDQVTCDQCKKATEKRDPFLDISLTIPEESVFLHRTGCEHARARARAHSPPTRAAQGRRIFHASDNTQR